MVILEKKSSETELSSVIVELFFLFSIIFRLVTLFYFYFFFYFLFLKRSVSFISTSFHFIMIYSQ